jgi:hypothetical protein
VLGELAPMFTHVWLSATLEELVGVTLSDAGAWGEADHRERRKTSRPTRRSSSQLAASAIMM